MMIKSPLKKNKVKENRRVLSGGSPAARKKGKSGKSIYSGGSASNGRPFANGQKRPKSTSLPVITPWKVILASFVIGVCGLLYIGHVFSTQQTLMEVQQLENEFNKTQRIYNEQRLQYDRMVGPKVIYQQARERGFINAGPADEIIHVKRRD